MLLQYSWLAHLSQAGDLMDLLTNFLTGWTLVTNIMVSTKLQVLKPVRVVRSRRAVYLQLALKPRQNVVVLLVVAKFTDDSSSRSRLFSMYLICS